MVIKHVYCDFLFANNLNIIMTEIMWEMIQKIPLRGCIEE